MNDREVWKDRSSTSFSDEGVVEGAGGRKEASRTKRVQRRRREKAALLRSCSVFLSEEDEEAVGEAEWLLAGEAEEEKREEEERDKEPRRSQMEREREVVFFSLSEEASGRMRGARRGIFFLFLFVFHGLFAADKKGAGFVKQKYWKRGRDQGGL